MSFLTFTTAIAEETPALSFFDYLGTLVEGQDGWIDPLTLADEQAAVAEAVAAEAAAAKAAAGEAAEIEQEAAHAEKPGVEPGTKEVLP